MNSNKFVKWLKEKETNPLLELEFRFGEYHPHKHTFTANIDLTAWIKIKNLMSENKELKKINSTISIQCYKDAVRKEVFFKESKTGFMIESTEYLIKKKVKTEDYKKEGIRFSVQTETPPPPGFKVDKICFPKCNRLKKRHQFVFDGYVVDMTEVRQAQYNECLDNFAEVLNESKNNAEYFNKYELEIEIDKKVPDELIKDIQQIIKTSKKSNNKNRNKNATNTTNTIFIPNYLRNFVRSKTNQVIGLKTDDIPIISQNYSITDKADGERHFLFCSNAESKKGFLFNKHFNGKEITFHPNGKNAKNKNKNKTKTDVDVNTMFPFCMEGEYLRVDGKPHFFIFDIFLLSGSSQITSMNQIERLKKINELLPYISSASSVNITLKKFYMYGVDFGDGTKKTLYDEADNIWNKVKFPYNLDGLIFTPQNEDYYGKIYKWKPPEEKSIDFFIKFEGTEPFSFSAGLSQQILDLTLYVLISRKKDVYHLLDVQNAVREYPQYRNSNTFPLIFQDENKRILGKTRLICDIKEINGFPTAFCNNIPILHQTVVEFIWKPNEDNKKDNVSGPWIPIKVRKDKTQDFLLGQKRGEFIGPNSYKTAIDTWKGINEEFPLTLLNLSRL